MLQKTLKTLLWSAVISISIGYTAHMIFDRETAKNDVLPFTVIEEEEEAFEELPGHYVSATYYNPVAEQCWGDPLVTASGKRIELEKLKREEIKWIAVSRDLLAHYNYGDKVMLSCAEDPSIDGIYYVEDTMNKRFKNKIDLLWHTDKKGKGKWNNVHIRKIEEP